MSHTPSRSAVSSLPFLRLVADDLLSKYGNDLSHLTIVFPNKRSQLFFNQHLVEASANDAPLWAPRYQTINELFSSLSALTIADPIDVVCRIHRFYTSLTGCTDSLDFFYGWGERLMADFENIDKNMADAARLLRNLADIKELESKGFLDEEQEKILQEFFRDFSLSTNTHIRERFLLLWNQLLPIYDLINAELRAEGMAYEGALQRRVVEELQSEQITLTGGTDKYAFVGFNVLNKVEEQLFSYLQKHNRAYFYWDYDRFYVYDNPHFEAGYFLRKNLELFPGELSATAFSNFAMQAGDEANRPHVELLSATSETAQAQCVTQWLNTHFDASHATRTAIVLCNEGLLFPVLHSLPAQCDDINITKGYPLTHTTAFALLNRWLTKAKNQKQTKSLIDVLNKLAEQIHQKAIEAGCKEQSTDSFLDILNSEAFYQCHTIINRFRNLIEQSKLDISLHTLHTLIRQVAAQTSIPFQGEPAVGLQIMGMLETRCLDFDNILILSAGDGNLPQRDADFSFIPYPIRVEFGLTTARHRNALQAYYFFRLLQRAKHIRITYNNATDGMSRGEMSRFVTQYLLEIAPNRPIEARQLTAEAICTESTSGKHITAINKPASLHEAFQHLSPSSINGYLYCPIKFYFEKVAKLKEPPTPPDVIEPNTMGTIFHKAAEYIYSPSQEGQPKLITEEMLSSYLTPEGKKRLKQFVYRAFDEEKIERNVVFAEVITSYLEVLIQHDIAHTPFTVDAVEMSTQTPLQVPLANGASHEMVLRGNIDRLDTISIDGITTQRILDYKTGGKPEQAESVEQLFEAGPKHPHYMLQACLYALTLVEQSKYPIAPALFFVNKAKAKDYSPLLNVAGTPLLRFQDIAHEFRTHLIQFLSELFNPEKPFQPTTEELRCNTCPFALLCNMH